MSVYKKFEPNDTSLSIIHTKPRIILSSGSLGSGSTIDGWRGNLGSSSSISLYEGVRSRRDVKSSDFVTSGISIFPLDLLDTHSIDKVILVSGSYPSTGSVHMVKIRNTPAPSFQRITSVDWYQEHFSPIELLYDYYSKMRPDTFFTGSYDYYSSHFKQNLPYLAQGVEYSGSGLQTMTSSFTIGAWINPTTVITGTQDFTIQSQRDRWKFYITGSSGKLSFSDFVTTLTSSAVIDAGIWQHVSLTVNNGSASFYVNSSLASTHVYTGTGTLAAYSGSGFLTVGAEQVLSQSLGPSYNTTSSFFPWNNGFKGFIHESRIWNKSLTVAQLSGNYDRTMQRSNSGSANLIHYSRFNDGPLGTRHGYTMGSGAFDYGRSGFHGRLHNYNSVLPHTPMWQPNDNANFIVPKTKILDSINMLKVIHVPSMFYGRGIATGSIVLTCNSYNNQGITRVINDDGRGGLYISGSITRSVGSGDYAGTKWNKVGNVFYSEGLIVITDPSLLDFGSTDIRDWSGSPDILQVSFDGSERIVTKTFSCHFGSAEYNASNNPTFSHLDKGGDDESEGIHKIRYDNVTYVTAIGLYNEERKLVAVVKLAQPIRKREKDKIVIRSRMDF